MIYIQFLLLSDNTETIEAFVEVPQVGDSVMLGGRLREVKHRRWVQSPDDGISDLLQFVPEVVVD